MVTTKDLARECGVSLTTVQRALHNNGRINEKTKEKILEKAKELNYQPDLIARTLVSGKSMQIGLIVPFFDNQYYPRLCNSLAEQVSKEGYILNILLHEDDKELEKKTINMLQGNHVDGIILNPINKGEDLLEILRTMHTNCCLLGIDEVDDCPIPCVGNDETKAGKAAMEYILQKGYRDVIFVVPTLHDADGVYNFGHHRRLDGILESAKKENVTPIIISSADYKQRILELFVNKKLKKPAILCSGEVFALGIISALAGLKKKIGIDYGIMTFDHSKSLEALNMNMTSIDNKVEEIGAKAGELMVQMCNDKDVVNRVSIGFEIIEGDTL